MNSCDLDKRLLDDLVDGELAQGERADVERHLERCSGCREELAALRLLIDAARDLEGIQPPRDLFPAIAQSVSSTAPARDVEAAALPRRASSRWLAAAAAVLLALLGGTAGWWWRGAPPPQQSAAVETMTMTPMTAGNGPDSAALVEIMAATDELANLVEARRGSISPETARILEQNLAIIDRAIGELRQYRQPHPGGDETLALNAMYKQKLELLRRATRLSS